LDQGGGSAVAQLARCLDAVAQFEEIPAKTRRREIFAQGADHSFNGLDEARSPRNALFGHAWMLPPSPAGGEASKWDGPWTAGINRTIPVVSVPIAALVAALGGAEL